MGEDRKIGILTFHKSINYGSVLQAWALQKMISLLGYQSEIIDYEPKEYYKIYGTKVLASVDFKRKVKTLLKFRKKEKLQFDKFDEFRNNELKLSKQKYNYNLQMDYLNEKYDMLITGSDQIWNINLLDCDPIFFLPFNFKGKKIAYACSINNGNVNERYTSEWLKQWINDYDFISIREKSGVDKIKSFLENDKKIYNALDPTLLLSKNDFISLVGKPLRKEKYIFLYNMWTKNEAIQAARILSEKLNLPVYTILNQIDLIRVSKCNMNHINVDIKNIGPKDFLNYIYYSSYTITDSFHGTAFSIIFNKEFFTLNSHLDKTTYKNDERLENILNHDMLRERFVTLDEIKSYNLNKKIDYEVINKYRMSLAEKSIHLLKSAIEG